MLYPLINPGNQLKSAKIKKIMGLTLGQKQYVLVKLKFYSSCTPSAHHSYSEPVQMYFANIYDPGFSIFPFQRIRCNFSYIPLSEKLAVTPNLFCVSL